MSLDDPKPVKVRIDWFMADVLAVEIELNEQALEEMVSHAAGYLRAGGPVPWDRWSLLSEASRTAFLMASERVKSGNGSIPASESQG